MKWFWRDRVLHNHYPEATWKPDKDRFDRALLNLENSDKIRSDMLKRMWIMWWDIPVLIDNHAWTWINPYFVYNLYWKTGLPPEVTLDKLKEKWFDVDGKWYEWCDFWLETFIKWDMKAIKKNFIIND